MKYFQTTTECLHDVKKPKAIHFWTGMERLALPPAAASPREGRETAWKYFKLKHPHLLSTVRSPSWSECKNSNLNNVNMKISR